MDPIATAAAAGMRSRMESLDLLANNLANASTSGFKNDSEFYTLYSSEQASSDAKLPMIKNQWTDFTQGLVQPTNVPLDLALSGKGFFAVQGPSGPLYTRNGGFRLSRAGVLENIESYAVRTVSGRPVRSLSPEPFDISADGTVRQSGQVLEQLELVDFPDPTALSKQGNNYFRHADLRINAQRATGAEVQQGRIENSNVSAADSAIRLVTVMRQFEMLQKAVTLAGEMDRKSMEEVAKVNS